MQHKLIIQHINILIPDTPKQIVTITKLDLKSSLFFKTRIILWYNVFFHLIWSSSWNFILEFNNTQGNYSFMTKEHSSTKTFVIEQ